jgi:gas vesicle protein
MADVTRQEEARKRSSRKGLVAGLVLGGIMGATAVVVFAPHSGAGQALTGMAKGLLAQAQAYLAAAREQVREAVEEGKAAAATTQTDLLARYEAIRANPDHPALPGSR